MCIAGSDYEDISPVTLSFSESITRQCFNICIINDDIFEKRESVLLFLSAIPEVRVTQVTVNIIDDEGIIVIDVT